MAIEIQDQQEGLGQIVWESYWEHRGDCSGNLSIPWESGPVDHATHFWEYERVCGFDGVIVLPGVKSCTSILDYMKEDVMKIQRRRFANFRKDQEHIADFQVKVNALVSMFHIYSSFFIQPNFQACLRIEESSQEASKLSYKYLACITF